MSPEFDPILGDPRLRDEATAGFAKGNLVAARHRYVLETWGQEMLDELVGRLSGPAKDLLARPPLPMGWHPLGMLAEVDRVIFDGPMGGDMGRMRRFGFVIADYDLSTLYRVLFKVGSPGFIVRRLPVAYGTYIRHAGTLRIEVDGRTANVHLERGLVPHYLCLAGMSGWMEAALTLSGSRQPRVEHVACRHWGDPECRWELGW